MYLIFMKHIFSLVFVILKLCRHSCYKLLNNQSILDLMTGVPVWLVNYPKCGNGNAPVCRILYVLFRFPLTRTSMNEICWGTSALHSSI